MEFIRTTSVNKIKNMKARKKVIQGGSSASKTYGILSILQDKASKTPNLEISVISESVPHLKKGALKDFIKIMKATKRWNETRYNATDRIYRFANGSYIEFFSPESVLGARRDILYINEANNISYEDYHQLSIRTNLEIFIDFNPVNQFWAHTEVLQESDSECLILNYLDNEALPPNVIGDFEQARLKAAKEKAKGVEGYWTNWCKVYIDGGIGSLQGAVFTNWEIIPKIPDEAKLLRHGLDFGFSNDAMASPTLFQWNGGLVLRENFYQTQMGLSELITACKALERADIMCDNSNPMLIKELQRAGLLAKPCIKGKDSIEYGISKLQQLKLYVTEDSLNFIKELRNYVIDPATNKPIDRFNHLIDPTRYAYITEPANSSSRGYTRKDPKKLNN
jgi:phage terminase large subunit